MLLNDVYLFYFTHIIDIFSKNKYYKLFIFQSCVISKAINIIGSHEFMILIAEIITKTKQYF